MDGVDGQVYLALQDWGRRKDEEQGQKGEAGVSIAAIWAEVS